MKKIVTILLATSAIAVGIASPASAAPPRGEDRYACGPGTTLNHNTGRCVGKGIWLH